MRILFLLLTFSLNCSLAEVKNYKTEESDGMGKYERLEFIEKYLEQFSRQVKKSNKNLQKVYNSKVAEINQKITNLKEGEFKNLQQKINSFIATTQQKLDQLSQQLKRLEEKIVPPSSSSNDQDKKEKD